MGIRIMNKSARDFAVKHLAECAADLMAIESGHKAQSGRLEELTGICRSISPGNELGAAKSLVREAAIEYSAIHAPSPYVPVR